MIRATYDHRHLISDILTRAFNANPSVNYIIKQDSKRVQRIRALVNYSFEVCERFGEVFLSDNRKACALILYPDKKKISLRSILLDIKLIVSCIGIGNVRKVLNRESKVSKLRPNEPLYYIWFIGTDPDFQNSGTGTELLSEVIADSLVKKRIACLETSVTKNIPWYERLGFQVYNELDLSYKIFFLKRESPSQS